MVERNSPIEALIPFFAMGTLFIIIDLLSLLLVAPFNGAGLYAFEDSGDPVNIAYFALMMFVTTGVILSLRMFRGGVFVRWVIRASILFSLFSTFYSLSWNMLGDTLAIVVSSIFSLCFLYTLIRWPRWYVIDAAAIILGTVTTTILGISLTAPLVSALLLLLIIYDAVSVYKTKHMLVLAEAIINAGLPLVLIVPKGNYKEGNRVEIIKERLQGMENRRAFYMGLGDLVLPGTLLVSIYSTLGSEGIPILFSVLFGTLVGFAILSVFVARGKPQAGLPLLCGGAVLAYAVSSYIQYRGLVGLF